MWAMDKDEFRRRYEPRIRVRMDWDLFDSPAVKAYRTALKLPDQLGLLWTPWYLGGTDGPPPETPDAEPLPVLQAAERVDELGHNAAGVCRHIEEAAPGDHDAPVLKMTGRRFLLLDRNHHTVAAAILRTDALLVLVVLEAPRSARLLFDLPPL